MSRMHGKPAMDLMAHALPRTPGTYLTRQDLFEPWLEALEPSREYRRLAAADGSTSKWIVRTSHARRAWAWWDGLCRDFGYVRWVQRLAKVQHLGLCLEVTTQADLDIIPKLYELDFPSRWNMLLVDAREHLDFAIAQGWANFVQFGSPGKYRGNPVDLDQVAQVQGLGIPAEVHWGGWTPVPEGITPRGRWVDLNLNGTLQSYEHRNGFARTGPTGQQSGLSVDWDELHKEW